jgi:nitrogen fixation NifU-like protein
MNNQFYKNFLMDHFKNPRNKKKINNCNFSSGKDNPACGDKISIEGIIEDGIIKDISFDGSGCVISQATASILTEECIGKPVTELIKLTKDDILKMIRLELGPNRLRCALISLESLHKGLQDYLKKN